MVGVEVLLVQARPELRIEAPVHHRVEQHLRADVAHDALRDGAPCGPRARALLGGREAQAVPFHLLEKRAPGSPRVAVVHRKRQGLAEIARALLALQEGDLVAHELQALQALEAVELRGVQRAQRLEHERLGLRDVGERERVQPLLAAAPVAEGERARGGRGERAIASARGVRRARRRGPARAARASGGTPRSRCGAAQMGFGKWRSSANRGTTCQCTWGVMLPRLARFILWGCIVSRTAASTANTTAMRPLRSPSPRSPISRRVALQDHAAEAGIVRLVHPHHAAKVILPEDRASGAEQSSQGVEDEFMPTLQKAERARCRRGWRARRSPSSSLRPAGGAPSRPRCSRRWCPSRDRSAQPLQARRARGEHLHLAVEAVGAHLRRALAHLLFLAIAHLRRDVGTRRRERARLAAAAVVQLHLLAPSARSRPSAAGRSSSACGRGRGTCSARRCTPSSLRFFSIRYSWMSRSRQPGKILSNSYFCSWSMQVPHDTTTVLMSR